MFVGTKETDDMIMSQLAERLKHRAFIEEGGVAMILENLKGKFWVWILQTE